MAEENNIFNKFNSKRTMIARLITIIILAGVVIYGISGFSKDSKVKQDTQNSPDKFTYNRAHDIASSVAEILLTRLSEDATYGSNTTAAEDLTGEKVTYIVEDTFSEDNNLIEIKVTAKSKDVTTVITTDINRETKRKERINVKYLYE